MAGEKILIVEDTEDVREALYTHVTEAGYAARTVGDGQSALRAFYEYQPDLVILDVLLPGTSGFDICERIRAMSTVPVVMFSAVGSEREKVWAFERGADDYVVKGTGMGEMLARIAASLRRAKSPAPASPVNKYTDDAIALDFASSTVEVRGKPVELTPTEYKLLTMLIKNKGRPVPSERLLHGVWGREYDTEELVKWHVGHLRQKVEEDPAHPSLIVTRRGFGYVYVGPGSQAQAGQRAAATPQGQHDAPDISHPSAEEKAA
jgi:DNA-binding response OmpR family regulator